MTGVRQTQNGVVQTTGGVVDTSADTGGGGEIPDSVVLQYDATELSFSDGDAVNTWVDSVGDNDVTGGDPVYTTNALNGNPVVRFDGTDDFLNTDISELTQPVTIIAVVDFNQNSSRQRIVYAGETGDYLGIYWSIGEHFSLTGGETVEGSNTATPAIISGVIDGSNSLLRENGTQTGSGDAGSHTWQSVELGASFGGSNPLDGDIAEVRIFDANLDSAGELENQESELADKWGISI